jgi:hypothetical protein
MCRPLPGRPERDPVPAAALLPHGMPWQATGRATVRRLVGLWPRGYPTASAAEAAMDSPASAAAQRADYVLSSSLSATMTGPSAFKRSAVRTVLLAWRHGAIRPTGGDLIRRFAEGMAGFAAAFRPAVALLRRIAPQDPVYLEILADNARTRGDVLAILGAGALTGALAGARVYVREGALFETLAGALAADGAAVRRAAPGLRFYCDGRPCSGRLAVAATRLLESQPDALPELALADARRLAGSCWTTLSMIVTQTGGRAVDWRSDQPWIPLLRLSQLLSARIIGAER